MKMGEKRRHKFIRCNKCRCNNDVTECIKNEDYDIDKYRENVMLIYCQECGQQLETELL